MLVTMLCLQSASATLLVGLMPESSYDDGGWTGSSLYDQDGMYALVEYSVYDRDGGNEFEDVGGFTNPGEGQYIYAYQVFSHPSLGTEEINLFTLLDITGAAIDDLEMDGATAIDDGDEGLAPGALEPTDGTWEWTFGSYIQQGDHSWLLVFSSDAAPVEGSYSLNSPGGESIAVLPEPCTLILLGLGSCLLLRKERRAV